MKKDMLNTCQKKINNFLFHYPGKVNLNIHNSLLIKRQLLLLIRLVLFLLMTIRYVYQIHKYYTSAFNGIKYLTEFSLALTWIYFSLVLLDYVLNEMGEKKYSLMLKDWVGLIYESAICLQFPVVVLFWGILYDNQHAEVGLTLLLELGVHGLPLVYLLIDLIFNIYQFQKRHFLFTAALGTVYLIINLGFSLTIEPVYKPINWVTPMCYVWVTLSLLLALLVHTLIRLYWTKYRKPLLNDYLVERDQKQESVISDI